MNEVSPAVFRKIFKDTPKHGVRIPNGFNGSQMEYIEALFEMTIATIETNKFYNGWTATLERSPLGEWRYSIEPKETHV